jgi:two-component system, chemotaxis family, chemotaxis protein CheY
MPLFFGKAGFMEATILIVEDTDLCREALELALQKLSGVRVRCVETAEQALRCLISEPVCALITDLHLQQMDGFDLIRVVRALPQMEQLPILVISGDCDPHTPARLRELGASVYLQKPYSPAEVRAKLEALIRPLCQASSARSC